MTEATDSPPAGERTVEELFREIQEGAAIGKAVAARRLPLRSLAGPLRGWTDLLEASIALAIAQRAQDEIAAQREALSNGTLTEFAAPSVHDWRCSAPSTAGTDITAWTADGWPEPVLQPPHERDQGPALRFVRRIAEATIDNLRGIDALLASGRSTRAPIALARIVLDGTAHGAFVIDPDADAEERLVRALNEMLSRLAEDYNDAVRSENLEGQAAADTAIRNIFAAAGERRRHNWNQQRRSTPFLGDSSVTTARMTRELLQGVAIWNVLSGVVHNREDEGWRMVLGVVSGMENPHRDSYVALYTFAAVLGAVRFVEVLETYTGWDLSAARAQSDSLCRAWADASGQNDDAHRAAVVAEMDAPQPNRHRAPRKHKPTKKKGRRR